MRFPIKYKSYLVLALYMFFSAVCVGQEKSPVIHQLLDLKGPYLGQHPPGTNPEVFAPGIISTGGREFNAVFSPDGKEFYFTTWSREESYIIRIMKETDKGWTKPVTASFSGKYMDFDMCISSDGNELFYCSKRPVPGLNYIKSGFDIWKVIRTGNGWSDPVHLSGPVNSGKHQIYPTLSENGTLYFTSDRDGTLGKRDVFKAKLVDGKYKNPENLSNAVNSEFDEGDAFIAPDESYIIVCAMGRPDCLGSGDLYISFRKKDGSWSKSENMGNKINTISSEYCPMLSPDGKYFFFTSGRKGSDDIYWVDAGIIGDYKPADLKNQ